jgi:hypothetical protein
MMRIVLLTLLASTTIGCGYRGMGGSPDMAELMKQQRTMVGQMPDVDRMMARSQLMQEMMSNPDIAPWHGQREKMALALGDRQFEQGFDRVFDSMTVALASIGCRVQNMEPVSGYLTASIPELPPTQMEALNLDAMRQYAVAKGYPPTIVEKSNSPYDVNIDAGSMMNRMTAGLTLSMVKQSPTMTKVKLRFDNVYYPALIDEYYKVVWQAVDKQMFLDKGLD